MEDGVGALVPDPVGVGLAIFDGVIVPRAEFRLRRHFCAATIDKEPFHSAVCKSNKRRKKRMASYAKRKKVKLKITPSMDQRFPCREFSLKFSSSVCVMLVPRCVAYYFWVCTRLLQGRHAPDASFE